jgi:TatD DNase family protein
VFFQYFYFASVRAYKAGVFAHRLEAFKINSLYRAMTRTALRFADIGANLTDAQFRGRYHGKQHHPGDLESVVSRAEQVGVHKVLVTGSNLKESKEAIKLVRNYPKLMHATVGVHPCHALDIDHSGDPARYLQQIKDLATEGKADGTVRAFGEIGLDYDRLHFAPADVQRKYFKEQLDIASEVGLPLFLHSRAAKDDFHSILSPYLTSGKLPKGGVVHSFTGTLDELRDLLSLGLYIGVNGCSLKNDDNLEAVKEIPLDRLMLETDGPWCEIRPTHSSYKKYLEGIDRNVLVPFEAVKKEKFKSGAMVRGRCEPCSIILVAQVVAGVKQIPVEEVCEAAWRNSCLFWEEELTNLEQ